MKVKISFVLLLFFMFSCIPLHTVKQIDNFRIDVDKKLKEEYFLFKPEKPYGVVKRSLRKQFKLNDHQKLKEFNTRLFENFDTEFKVTVEFEGDRSVSLSYVPTITNNEEPETEIGDLEVFVKIKVFDSSGENCLSTRSLFYDKTRSFLIHLKDNITIEPLF